MTSPNERVVLVLSVELLGAADEAVGVGQVEVAADLLHHSIVGKNQIFQTNLMLDDWKGQIVLINLVAAHFQVFSVRRF
jgi:hypothetical protein